MSLASSSHLRKSSPMALSVWQCRHISKFRKGEGILRKACTCRINSESLNTSGDCTECHHPLNEHRELSISSSCESDSNMTPLPTASSIAFSQQSIAAPATVSAVLHSLKPKAKNLLAAINGEANRGMRPVKVEASLPSRAEASQTKSTRASSGSKSSKDKDSSKLQRIAGIVVNIRGITNTDGRGEAPVVPLIADKTVVDNYAELGLAKVDCVKGITIDTSMSHDQVTEWLTTLFPFIANLYLDQNSSDESAPWALGVRSYKSLSITAIAFPTALQLYAKRTSETQSWQKQFIYIVTRRPMRQELIQKYTVLTSVVFNRYWNTLAVKENWVKDESEDEPMKDIQEEIDDSTDEEIQAVAEPIAQNRGTKRSAVGNPGGSTHTRKVSRFSYSEKGKGKEVIELSDSESFQPSEASLSDSGEQADDDAMIVESTLYVSSPASAPVPDIADPWAYDRLFALP